MQHFHNILYVSTGLDKDTLEGLKQALSLARNNQANLKFLLVHPELPVSQVAYREMYHAFFEVQAQEMLQSARAMLAMGADVVPNIKVELESLVIPPAISIIRHVLRDAHDLLIKEAEFNERGKGFKALDMTLLRKCPCPVWLARAISTPREAIQVAVAINPESRSEEEQALSLRLLELAHALAATCSGELNIISCWDYVFESFLRHNGRAEVPEEEIFRAVLEAQAKHRYALQYLIDQAGLPIKRYHIHHLRGAAETLIPHFVELKQVDILVMGSVARTGITGFLIGNTAENIAEELGCSLLALKPAGFVSPISAY